MSHICELVAAYAQGFLNIETMKIVINHLTRMQKGCICTAGIDLQTGRHVRPMLRSQLRTDLLVRNGGPFDIGCVVDLGDIRYIGEPPATEDRLFKTEQVRRGEDISGNEFWHWISSIAQPKLKLVFGDELHKCGRRSYAVDKNHGQVSLGCYVPPTRPRLLIQQWDETSRGRIRMEFADGQYEFDLAVTDIRLFQEDHVTPDPAAVSRTNDRLQTAERMILSVGLTRPIKITPNQPTLHYLQVNNVHFSDQPCWQLG